MKKALMQLLILMTLMQACHKNDVDVYGAKNTVTVNFPDGIEVYPVELQQGDIVEPIRDSMHISDHDKIKDQLSATLYIHDSYSNSKMKFILIFKGAISFPSGKTYFRYLNDWSMINFDQGDIKFDNQVPFDDGYIQIDDLQLGRSINDPGAPSEVDYITEIKELKSVKGRFQLTMHNVEWINNQPHHSLANISGTIHISQDN